jgi:hypothetical protein
MEGGIKHAELEILDASLQWRVASTTQSLKSLMPASQWRVASTTQSLKSFASLRWRVVAGFIAIS